jgi:hypothetical protein
LGEVGCFQRYEVPSAALSAELAQGYERTMLLSYRVFFGWIGGLTLTSRPSPFC